MKHLLVVLVALFLAPFAGCGSSTAPSPVPVVVTEAQSGTSVTLGVDGTLSVRLTASPSTGYEWQMADAPADGVLRASGSGYDAPNTTLLGAPGVSWWTYQAASAGSTALRLRYVRPWEPATALQEFTLNVVVR